MTLLQPPVWARYAAWLLVLILVVGPFVLVLVPWQQNVSARGRVMAFDPADRQQEIEAPIAGRITRWHAVEGQSVKKGDPLVTIEDPDPQLPRRLADNKAAIIDREKAGAGRVASFGMQIKALEESRKRALAAAAQRLEAAGEVYEGARRLSEIAGLNENLASLNLGMEEKMVNEGLTSALVFQTARQRRLATQQERLRARNGEAAARLAVAAIREDLEKIRGDADAGISAAMANRQSAEAEVAQAGRDLADIDIRIARQATQEVASPCDGTIFRIAANGSFGGNIVKDGERLMIIVPRLADSARRAVELYLDGNDAPQLTELWRQRLVAGSDGDIKVRLQFEGWPAVQWIGWPSLAVGTFAGRVTVVDMQDDGKGRFRVLVEPDPSEASWPDDFVLRQGTRVQGYVLLGRVTIGYELWRRFNGFPPVTAGDKDDKAKPAKVKVPK